MANIDPNHKIIIVLMVERRNIHSIWRIVQMIDL
jgi:hypothetical protein